ncbi:MAG: hypothetical protein WD671_04815 [Parvibaculum sp.]
MADHRHEIARAPEVRRRVSAFGTGLRTRLAVAGMAIVVLWLAVFWALAR